MLCPQTFFKWALLCLVEVVPGEAPVEAAAAEAALLTAWWM
jgi:hypothetical protein